MIKIKIFVVNAFGVNSFVLNDETGECVIIDPGFYSIQEQETLTDYIKYEKLKPVMALCTHGHVDHVLANNFIDKTYNIPIALHKEDEMILQRSVDLGSMFGLQTIPSPPVKIYLNEGEDVRFGNSRLEVLHVPGHSKGSVAFYSPENKFLIAGDVLFNGSIGRTDLPGGNYKTIIDSINTKLFRLPSETVVYPGHGDKTTIGTEHDTNPFFK